MRGGEGILLGGRMGERSLGKHTGVVCRGVREGWDKGGEDGEGGKGEVHVGKN